MLWAPSSLCFSAECFHVLRKYHTSFCTHYPFNLEDFPHPLKFHPLAIIYFSCNFCTGNTFIGFINPKSKHPHRINYPSHAAHIHRILPIPYPHFHILQEIFKAYSSTYSYTYSLLPGFTEKVAYYARRSAPCSLLLFSNIA